MKAWYFIAVLEKYDPSFQDLFYPRELRCQMDKRIIRAIEERWPVYFPTRKECRGKNWSISIPETEPLYRPKPKSLEKLAQWKNRIWGTIAEGRAYCADTSWRRFLKICQKSADLRPILGDFMPLFNFLIREEEMWPRYGGVAVGMDEALRNDTVALLASESPYRHSDPSRLRFLRSRKQPIEKLQLIRQMRYWLDCPLMSLAILQKCAESKRLLYWLDLRNHIKAILKAPVSISFRKTWFEHAMQMAEATKKSAKSCPRKWARLLLNKRNPDLSEINAKAVEVNSWLKGKKLPSLKNIQRSWDIITAPGRLSFQKDDRAHAGWILSWMISLLMENHFDRVSSIFKGDLKKIRNYYRRFFLYLKIE